MSKFGELNLEEKETALNWTKRLEDVYECSDLPNKDAFETGRLTETKIGHPLRIGPGQFQNFKGVFGRVVRSLLGSHNHDWEIIQQELTHISSYEYFICKKLQQQERQYLKNIRIGLLGMVALLALNTLTGIHPYGLSSAASIVALFAWAIYSIKLYRVDLAGLWKCEAQCHLIWSSVNSRILEDDK